MHTFIFLCPYGVKSQFTRGIHSARYRVQRSRKKIRSKKKKSLQIIRTHNKPISLCSTAYGPPRFPDFHVLAKRENGKNRDGPLSGTLNVI